MCGGLVGWGRGPLSSNAVSKGPVWARGHHGNGGRAPAQQTHTSVLRAQLGFQEELFCSGSKVNSPRGLEGGRVPKTVLWCGNGGRVLPTLEQHHPQGPRASWRQGGRGLRPLPGAIRSEPSEVTGSACTAQLPSCWSPWWTSGLSRPALGFYPIPTVPHFSLHQHPQRRHPRVIMLTGPQPQHCTSIQGIWGMNKCFKSDSENAPPTLPLSVPRPWSPLLSPVLWPSHVLLGGPGGLYPL